MALLSAVNLFRHRATVLLIKIGGNTTKFVRYWLEGNNEMLPVANKMCDAPAAASHIFKKLNHKIR